MSRERIKSREYGAPIEQIDLFLAAIRLDNGARYLLRVIMGCQEKGDPLTVRQGELARIFRKDLRTINRWIRDLKKERLVRVVKARKRRFCRYYLGPRYTAWKKRGL